MHYLNVKNYARAYGAALFISLGIIFSPVASATTTQVNAAICGDVGSTITITSPLSDSTVDVPSLVIEGTVANATQITSTVNGQYSQTLALSISQTTFELTETLAAGTNTIELVANDVCQVQNGSDNVIVTYEPDTDPGSGGETPTEIDGGGVVIGGQPQLGLEDQPLYEKIRTLAVVGPLFQLVEASLRAIGLDATIERSGILATALRVGLLFGGLMMVLFASVILQNFNLKIITAMHAVLPRGMRGKWLYRLWTVRLFGLLFVLTALMI